MGLIPVPWRATASSRTVESRTRRCLPVVTPVSVITANVTSASEQQQNRKAPC